MKSKSSKTRNFKILDTGNFYFPLNQIGKKFKVKDTYTLEIKDKVLITIVKETIKNILCLRWLVKREKNEKNKIFLL